MQRLEASMSIAMMNTDASSCVFLPLITLPISVSESEYALILNSLNILTTLSMRNTAAPAGKNAGR